MLVESNNNRRQSEFKRQSVLRMRGMWPNPWVFLGVTLAHGVSGGLKRIGFTCMSQDHKNLLGNEKLEENVG